MPLLSDVVIFFISVVVLTANGNFWVVLLLHSVSDMMTLMLPLLGKKFHTL